MARILVVEDESAIRQRLSRALAYEGYEVLEAADGQEGLELVRHSRPDLVIADLLMPRMDGIEFLATLRAEARTRHTPVLLLTALPEESTERTVAGLGATTYLIKPLSIANLLETIERELGSDAGKRAEEETPA